MTTPDALNDEMLGELRVRVALSDNDRLNAVYPAVTVTELYALLAERDALNSRTLAAEAAHLEETCELNAAVVTERVRAEAAEAEVARWRIAFMNYKRGHPMVEPASALEPSK